MRSLFLLVVVLLSVALAPAPLPRRERTQERPDLSGSWAGDDWGKVELRKTKSGDYEGTYTDTYGGQPGRIILRWDARGRCFVGTWREGQDRFGELSVELLPGKKGVKGEFRADPNCKINGGSPGRARLQWRRP